MAATRSNDGNLETWARGQREFTLTEAVGYGYWHGIKRAEVRRQLNALGDAELLTLRGGVYRWNRERDRRELNTRRRGMYRLSRALAHLLNRGEAESTKIILDRLGELSAEVSLWSSR